MSERNFRWQRHDFGFWAYSGQHVIGAVGERYNGKIYWRLTAVEFSKWQRATNGEVSTMAQAKKSLRRAWLWRLEERGLTEVSRARASGIPVEGGGGDA